MHVCFVASMHICIRSSAVRLVRARQGDSGRGRAVILLYVQRALVCRMEGAGLGRIARGRRGVGAARTEKARVCYMPSKAPQSRVRWC